MSEFALTPNQPPTDSDVDLGDARQAPNDQLNVDPVEDMNVAAETGNTNEPQATQTDPKLKGITGEDIDNFFGKPVTKKEDVEREETEEEKQARIRRENPTGSDNALAPYGYIADPEARKALILADVENAESLRYETDNKVDDDGNPAGGSATGTGIDIQWQNGPLGRGEDRQEPNGAFVEDIIRIAIDRLSFYQGTRFACNENADAVSNLQMALTRLNDRTARRNSTGVEGTHNGN